MKYNILTSFSAGLLLATAITGGAYFVTKDDAQAKSTTAEETTKEEATKIAKTPTVDEMKKLLSSSGYVVQSEEEAKAKETEWNQKIEDAKKQAASSDSSKVVYRTTVYVSDGMTSIDVGNALKSAKIIKETGFQFSKKVEKKGVEKYLKPGGYEIDSTMSTDKIISTIFKK